MVNGAAVNEAVTKGVASYVAINRTWAEGDKITVWLPMELTYEECPNYTDYIAFKFGPILLAAQTTAASEEEAAETGLKYEKLQNEYAGAGRMDHAPGSRASARTCAIGINRQKRTSPRVTWHRQRQPTRHWQRELSTS